MPYIQDHVNPLLGGGGQNAGLTIDTSARPNSQRYYFDEISLTEANSPVTIDLQAHFGGIEKGSVVDIFNLTSTAGSKFSVEYSLDGTNYGPPITVYNTVAISEIAWQAISKIRLTRIADDSTAWVKVI